MAEDKQEYAKLAHEGELQRLADQHALFTACTGRLTFAPVDFSQPNLRILDSGTADGLWLRDLQQSVAMSYKHTNTYVGTDINPAFFPKEVPPGLSFQVQSITQDWADEWASSFDYVHQRTVLAGAGRSPLQDCITRLVRLAKPGGWVELVEFDWAGESSSSTNGPVMRQFEAMMRKLMDMVGVGSGYARAMKICLERSGVEEVHERVFDVTYGAANTDAELRRKSVAVLVAVAERLLQITKGQKDTDLDEKEWGDFLARMRKELETEGARVKTIALWTRRPAEG